MKTKKILKMSSKANLHVQKGVVLIVALIMLLVMTAIGVSLMSGATLQERMAGNSRQLSVARLNAESAIREAESFIEGLQIESELDVVTNFDAGDDTDGLLITNYSTVREDDGPSLNMTVAENWDLGRNPNLITGTALDANVQAPRYFIEYLGRLPSKVTTVKSLDAEDKNKQQQYPYVFRVTAIGFGRDPNINAILQSTYSTSAGVR